MAKYKFLQDYTATLSNSNNTVLFLKNDVIQGAVNPYYDESLSPKMIATTYERELPNFQSVGQIWINIPANMLEEIKENQSQKNDKAVFLISASLTLIGIYLLDKLLSKYGK